MPEFTHKQIVESVIGAITAITDGKSEEECKAKAAEAMRVIQNSNSMPLLDAIDAELNASGLLATVEVHVADAQLPQPVQAPQLPAPNPEIPF